MTSYSIRFSLWLISLSITPSRPIRAVADSRIFFFLMVELPHWAYIHLVYSFIHPGTQVASVSWLLWIKLQWTRGMEISLTSWFHFLCIWTREWVAGSHGRSIFNFSVEPPYCFPQWLCQFTFPSTVNKCPLFFTSSPMLVSSCLFDNIHSNWWEAISRCGFDLHVPVD